MSLLVVPVVAVVLRVWLRVPFLRTFLFATAVMPLVVMLRVMVEVGIDPTSHNLWPFELAIALFLGGFVGLVGAGLGELVARTLPSGAVSDR